MGLSMSVTAGVSLDCRLSGDGGLARKDRGLKASVEAGNGLTSLGLLYAALAVICTAAKNKGFALQ